MTDAYWRPLKELGVLDFISWLPILYDGQLFENPLEFLAAEIQVWKEAPYPTDFDILSVCVSRARLY